VRIEEREWSGRLVKCRAARTNRESNRLLLASSGRKADVFHGVGHAAEGPYMQPLNTSIIIIIYLLANLLYELTTPDGWK